MRTERKAKIVRREPFREEYEYDAYLDGALVFKSASSRESARSILRKNGWRLGRDGEPTFEVDPEDEARNAPYGYNGSRLG